jgi:hypothetical protein
MKTAVEWLVNELKNNHGIDLKLYNEFDKAKAMEKEQIIEAHEEGFYSPPFRMSRRREAEQYYKETFKSE